MAILPGVEPGFDAIINNPAKDMMTAPMPKTPEEVQGRKQQWASILDDPNAKGALLRMGLNLMRGTRQGETGLGAVGRTAIDAMDYYGFKTELDRQRGMQERKFGLETRDTESRIKDREQGTQQEAAKFQEWQQGSAQRKEKADLEIKNLQRTGRLEEARQKKAEFEAAEAEAKDAFLKANPGLREQAMKAEVMAPVAELERTNAQTSASRANADQSSASASATRGKSKREQEEYDALPNWIRVIPDEEARTYATAQKGKKTQSEIEADIAAGKHIGTTSKGAKAAGGGAGGGEYTDLARSIVDEYSRLPAADKARYPTIDSYIYGNYNVTLGKSASGVVGEARRLAGETQEENWVRDPKTGKLVKSP